MRDKILASALESRSFASQPSNSSVFIYFGRAYPIGYSQKKVNGLASDQKATHFARLCGPAKTRPDRRRHQTVI
jgi:hypothetical protein